MAYYPKIAMFQYIDKNIDIKLPIRAKLIKLKKYYCKNCDKEGTLNDIIKHYENNAKKENNGILYIQGYKYNSKFGKIGIPEEILKGNKILCPICLKETKLVEKEMLKFYICSKPEFIKLDQLLTKHTLLRWKPDFHGNLCAYPRDLDSGIKKLEYVNSKNSFKKKLFPNARLRINRKVDMSLLKSELREYDKRKMIDAL